MPSVPPVLPGPGEGRAAEAIARLPGGKRLSPRRRAVLAGAGFAVVVLGAFAWRPWGFLFLGAVVGGLVVASVPAARAAFAPVGALAVALLPLVLPLFVFAGAGVVASSGGVRFAVGLATLLLAAAVVRPEWVRARAALEPQPRTRSLVRGAAQVALPSLTAFAGVGVVLGLTIDLLAGGDAAPRTFFVAAVGALVAALVLRIVGYGRTVTRALVAVALLWLLAHVSVDIGLFSGGLATHGSTKDAAVTSGVLLAVAAVVELLTALLTRDAAIQTGLARDELPRPVRAALLLEASATARWLTDRLNLAGLGFALLSAVLLMLAVFTASFGDGAQEDLSGTPHGGATATPPGGMSDGTLAAAFSPVLVLTKDQRLTPTSVDAYVEGARVRDWQGHAKRVSSVAELATDCPGAVRTPCYVMRQSCPRGVDSEQCAEDLPNEKAIYVRVARKSQWTRCRTRPCADGSPNPFAKAKGDWATETSILVQYWFFYPYNKWVAPVAVGELKEIHAADWEAVTVGLSDSGPLWIAYSAHCAGTFAAWEQVRVPRSDPTRLHPLVAVAEGSQANYRVAENDRVPNFAECKGIRNDRLRLMSHAANILDHTDDAQRWKADPTDLRLVDATKSPMSFPGTWAPWARMRLDTLHKSIRLGGDGAGPASPPLQPLWERPMNAIFGGGAWKAG